MTLHERRGERDLAYSYWHRPDSIGRFLPRDQAEALTAIDIDEVECCHDCSRPLMLLEIARDVGQNRFKPTTITAELARLAGLPAALVFYEVDEDGDIARFRVRYVAPRRTRELELAPAEYATWLQSLRARHACTAKPTSASCGFPSRTTRSRRQVRPAAHPGQGQFRIPESVSTHVSPRYPSE